MCYLNSAETDFLLWMLYTACASRGATDRDTIFGFFAQPSLFIPTQLSNESVTFEACTTRIAGMFYLSGMVSRTTTSSRHDAAIVSFAFLLNKP